MCAARDAEVAVERDRGLASEWAHARSSPLAEHDDDVVVEIDVGHREMDEFGAPHPRIDEQTQDRLVATLLKPLALGRPQQAL